MERDACPKRKISKPKNSRTGETCFFRNATQKSDMQMATSDDEHFDDDGMTDDGG